MQKKQFVLQNRGMNRDLSISKVGESSAYENHNVRILARDNDTLLSVTNERGNKEVPLTDAIEGTLLGWNVLNNHIILFTHVPNTENDKIYRIDYFAGEEIEFVSNLLFDGDLGFELEHPIESVVYFESEDVQKIYWVDGIHVLRFMNFMADETEQASWNADPTYFDSNRSARFDVNVKIEKDNSGNPRANGVVQYLLTYFNRHGQETGYVWVSDLVYLAPPGRGGAADETNSNSVRLTISNLDSRFTNFRVYSIFRSSYDGIVTAYLVEEGTTDGDYSIVVDDGAHLVAQDANRLLYLGSQPVHAYTLDHKDQTLFLGNLQSLGRDFSSVENAVKTMYNPSTGLSSGVRFVYSDADKNIPYIEDQGSYSYENQLKYTSSEITTFKGGEKYRFAIKLQLADGTESPAFWIGDAVNDKYPRIMDDGKSIRRPIAECTLNGTVINAIRGLSDGRPDLEVKTVQLCIAEATYADRSVKAQGILNPTMFNVWERYNNRTYSIPSWISRPRGVEYAHRHFQPVANSIKSTGEIACNYWPKESSSPRPFYRYKNYMQPGTDYEDTYNGQRDYDFSMVVYHLYLSCQSQYSFYAIVELYRMRILPDGQGHEEEIRKHRFSPDEISADGDNIPKETETVIYSDNECVITYYRLPTMHTWSGSSRVKWGIGCDACHAEVVNYFRNNLGMYEARGEVVSKGKFADWFGSLNHGIYGTHHDAYFLGTSLNNNGYGNRIDCLNDGYSSGPTLPSPYRWKEVDEVVENRAGSYSPSYYTKQYMFVDENVVTLNSPEFDYEAVSIDGNTGLKLRVVGVAKVTSGYSDYTVLASPGKKPGSNVVDDKFSWTSTLGDWTSTSGNANALMSWPLWEDANLEPVEPGNDEELPPVEDRTSENYKWGEVSYHYWMYMWGRIGSITGYNDPDGNDYGFLQRKVFANMKFCYLTQYCNTQVGSDYRKSYPLESLRQYNYTTSQNVQLSVGQENKYYNGNVQMGLSVPDLFKYPIPWNYSRVDVDSIASTSADDCLYSQDPVQLEFLSNPHVVMSLGSYFDNGYYHQVVLPYVFSLDTIADSIPIQGYGEDSSENIFFSDSFLPWLDDDSPAGYRVDEDRFVISGMNSSDKYFLIGEIYEDYDENNPDTRYGGITASDIENNRFIPAGPQYLVSDINRPIYGTQGDTYFQRWDCLKTKPFSSGAVNNVIDITSFMVETHINIDGRTDLQRGVDRIASIDTETFGQINRVYSQPNNYRIQRDLDDDANTDVYKSAITWTLPKEDLADVDEWTHVTLGASLNLDGDKGSCNAIRRFQNNLIAFQDRGIAEILFNSRTQLTTQDGVPVEIGNSGKVDGKRYITNHFGCTNKWSIVEGKNALYFVDNINKAFCSFGGNGISSISTKQGFDVWFRRINELKPWEPVNFDNIRSYYDKVNADVYLVKGSDDDMSCLVYNENLDAFTSFFDYGYVPMMTNVMDRFVSFSPTNHLTNSLWLQNEGLYCNFFGMQHDFWMWYRVTPEPYSDKIWTNVDYRADFYDVLNDNGENVIPEQNLINGDVYGEYDDIYKEDETFDTMRMWNEYQTTGDIDIHQSSHELDPVRKKFRIWRVVVPRALKKEDMTRRTLDRIRNPWTNLMFRKQVLGDNSRYLMQLHDFIVTYFE